MTEHTSFRGLLLARLAIARKREAVLRDLDAIDAEARPLDAAIRGAMEREGAGEVHLEFMDGSTWRRYSVRCDGWGRHEFIPAANCTAIRYPAAPLLPRVAEAATDAPVDDPVDERGEAKPTVVAEALSAARSLRDALGSDDPIVRLALAGAAIDEYGDEGEDMLDRLVGVDDGVNLFAPGFSEFDTLIPEGELESGETVAAER